LEQDDVLNSSKEYDAIREGADLSRVSAVGKPIAFRRAMAFELMWQADECPDLLLAASMAMRAVRIDPFCLDARLFLARFAIGPHDEYVMELRSIVDLGEQDMGEQFMEENRGHFWAIVATRPYMRARAKLAEELHVEGRIAESIAEYESLLVLNPNDNQAIRYSLLGCYLEVEDLDRAGSLFRIYDEASAIFLWGHVLERYLAGDLSAAVEALGNARRQNPHVEGLLTGKKKMPKARTEFYQPGDVSEALVCMDEIGAAWKCHREAITWLKKEHGTGNLFTKPRKRRK